MKVHLRQDGLFKEEDFAGLPIMLRAIREKRICACQGSIWDDDYITSDLNKVTCVQCRKLAGLHNKITLRVSPESAQKIAAKPGEFKILLQEHGIDVLEISVTESSRAYMSTLAAFRERHAAGDPTAIAQGEQ